MSHINVTIHLVINCILHVQYTLYIFQIVISQQQLVAMGSEHVMMCQTQCADAMGSEHVMMCQTQCADTMGSEHVMILPIASAHCV